MFHGQETYDYHQCVNCKAVYQHPIPKAEVIASFYPDNYRIYDDNVRMKKRGQLERAVLKDRYGYKHLQVPTFFRAVCLFLGPFIYNDNVRYKPHGKALDVGCGNGHFLQDLKQIGWDCGGVEFNITAVNVCRSRGLQVHHGDLESANFPDCSFDVVTASHVIEHVPDPDSFIKESARILRHDGHLLIKTPNSEAFGRKWFGKYWFANEVPRHLFLFSLSNLDMLASRNGLKRIDVKQKTTPKYILNSIDYKTGNVSKPSRKRKFLRLLARLYVLVATLSGRGDRIHVTYQKT